MPIFNLPLNETVVLCEFCDQTIMPEQAGAVIQAPMTPPKLVFFCNDGCKGNWEASIEDGSIFKRR